jgi:hypothetical protein
MAGMMPTRRGGLAWVARENVRIPLCRGFERARMLPRRRACALAVWVLALAVRPNRRKLQYLIHAEQARTPPRATASPSCLPARTHARTRRSDDGRFPSSKAFVHSCVFPLAPFASFVLAPADNDAAPRLTVWFAWRPLPHAAGV